MASIQIAVDAPICTKKEFLRRTGMPSSTFDRQKDLGNIPVVQKRVSADGRECVVKVVVVV